MCPTCALAHITWLICPLTSDIYRDRMAKTEMMGTQEDKDSL